MSGTHVPPGAIVVYGATGYTGRLVAAELGRAGDPFVLAGRNRAKLEIVAGDTPGNPLIAAVSVDDAAGLRELFEPAGAVIACAGPFSLHGEPVVRAAAEAGTHYVDTTGEQTFMRRVFDEFGPLAEGNGAALVTAMGFDYFPGDMIASLTAEGMGELEELTLAYAVKGFGPSRGTAHSALEMIGGGDWEWLEGELTDADRSVSRGKFTFPEPIGTQRMTRYPAGEHITVPRHVPTRTVRTSLTAFTSMPPGMAVLAPVLMPGFQLALRTPIRGGLDRLIRRLPEGPSEEARRAARFTIVCEARAGSRRRRGIVSANDVYGITARSVADAARRMLDPSFAGAGALAPSEAFDPRSFLDGFSDFGLTYDVVPVGS